MALAALVVLVVALGAAALVANGLRRRDRGHDGVCWAIGYAAALVTWLFPGAVAWTGEHVPGGAVLRDGSRLLLLSAPLVAR